MLKDDLNVASRQVPTLTIFQKLSLFTIVNDQEEVGSLYTPQVGSDMATAKGRFDKQPSLLMT